MYSALIKTLLVWEVIYVSLNAILILDFWLQVFNNRLMLLPQYLINKTCLEYLEREGNYVGMHHSLSECGKWF